MRTWSIFRVLEDDESYRFELAVEYVPWWAEAAAGFVEFVDARLTGHLLCGTPVGYDLVGWALAFRDLHTLSLHRCSVSAEVGVLLWGREEDE